MRASVGAFTRHAKSANNDAHSTKSSDSASNVGSLDGLVTRLSKALIMMRTPASIRILPVTLEILMALNAATMMRTPSNNRIRPAMVDVLVAARGPQRTSMLNAGGLQALTSSRLPAFKGDRGVPRSVLLPPPPALVRSSYPTSPPAQSSQQQDGGALEGGMLCMWGLGHEVGG